MSVDRRDFVKTFGGGVAALASASKALGQGSVKTRATDAGKAATGLEPAAFVAAKPVWPAGRSREKNLFVGFRASFVPTGGRVRLRLTGSSICRYFLNGEFLGYGPARGPLGWFRIDEWDLTPRLRTGSNVVAIEVAGYNVNGYYLLDQPAFLQAEVLGGKDEALAATGDSRGSFEASVLAERVQKIQRYSFQRPFIEVYRLQGTHGQWRKECEVPFAAAKCESVPAGRYLPRGVPYPEFFVRQPLFHLSRGTVKPGRPAAKLWKDRALTNIGPTLGGYPEAELEVVISTELQGLDTKFSEHYGTAREGQPDRGKAFPWETKIQSSGHSFDILDFGTNLSGFLRAKVTCRKAARLFFIFDEVLTNNDVDFRRLDCVNAVTFSLEPGTYQLESFEPYTLRYLKLIVMEGEVDVEDISLREYTNPDVWRAHFASADERLNRLFAAGRETFRQNAVDLFTDCPSRERAGWLCDSFFTSRAAADLNGNTLMERAFLENYLLPEKFEFLPAGMVPMCYPADHNDGNFIPNWALWFVLQLEEYVKRSGDRTLAEALRPRVMGIFRYFEPFRNSDGLLEKLQGWVFVEWSKANDFVQDVNYPSNMIYAAALAAAGRMYNDPRLAEQATTIRKTVVQQSFDGEFFVDNALRRNGQLQVTRNRTEVCQYFAFFFDTATPESHPELWRRLREQFGPHRKEKGTFPEIHPANAFVGNMLRMEILSRYGYSQQVLDESVAYLLYMEERTGTLWENDGAYASCDHGFASHIVRTLYRDVLGVYEIDPVGKRVRLRFSGRTLPWCEGDIPTPAGPVSLRWRLEGNRLQYRASAPAGFTVEVESQSGLELSPALS